MTPEEWAALVVKDLRDDSVVWNTRNPSDEQLARVKHAVAGAIFCAVDDARTRRAP